MSQKETLKPCMEDKNCPFCGEPPRRRFVASLQVELVTCDNWNCPLEESFYVEDWNTRAETPTSLSAVESAAHEEADALLKNFPPDKSLLDEALEVLKEVAAHAPPDDGQSDPNGARWVGDSTLLRAGAVLAKAGRKP